MEVVQSKLKETVSSGSMKSFDRIANMLDTDGDMVEEVTAPPSSVEDARGENKAPVKRGKSRKHKLRSKRTSPTETKKVERPKPKYFCEF